MASIKIFPISNFNKMIFTYLNIYIYLILWGIFIYLGIDN